MEIVYNFLYDWPKRYAWYTVVRYVRDTKTDYFIDRNKKGKHAEDFLIEHFESLLEQRKLGSPIIKIYITNSPCGGCCKKLINFVGTTRSKYDTSLEVEVVFSSFYGVRRPSREKNQNYTGYLPSECQHKDHVKWLKKLQAANVCLKTFSKDDWLELLEATGVKDFDFNGRKKEDDLLRKDFEIVMNINTFSLRDPEENDFTDSSFLKGTIQASPQPKTTTQEVSGDGSHQDQQSPITSQVHNVQIVSQNLSSGHIETQNVHTTSQNLSEYQETPIVHTTSQDQSTECQETLFVTTSLQNLSSEDQEAQNVRCKVSGTIMTTNDTEATEARQGGTGKVSVEKRNLDKETQTEPLLRDQLTPDKVKTDKETVEKGKLEQETQSEPLQTYRIAVDKEKFEVELMELKLQTARRQNELKAEILQSKKECSRLQHLKLYYEVRKLERQLGVPENTRIAADVPFKVDG